MRKEPPRAAASADARIDCLSKIPANQHARGPFQSCFRTAGLLFQLFQRRNKPAPAGEAYGSRRQRNAHGACVGTSSNMSRSLSGEKSVAVISNVVGPVFLTPVPQKLT